MKVFIFCGKLSLVFVLILSFVFSHVAKGVGAYPYPQEITQADGSVLTVYLHGDEWFNWVSTKDGYRIEKNESGLYEYVSVLKSGSIQTSGVLASDPEYRSNKEKEYLNYIEKGPGVDSEYIQQKRREKTTTLLKSSISTTLFAPTGSQKMLVILVSYSDTSPSHSQQDFDRLMNEEGYNGTGSFRDYYLENSGGKLDISSVVTQWVTVPNSKAYYAEEEKWGELAKHAIEAADASVDFSEFDNDGDGIVEGVAIIHQGPGQEVTGSKDDVWSHSWTLSGAGYSSFERSYDGVWVDRYTMQPETRNESGEINTMGVIAHEFGHNLGLPDYYDTNTDDEVDYKGTGIWDMMASGTYNGSPSGSSPSHHNPLSKYELGWVEMVELTSAGSKIIAPIIDDGVVYKISSVNDNEYLLLENRRKVGFDVDLKGEGMVVYHVDDQVIATYKYSNDINTREHQGLNVVAAGGDINSASAPFPGSLGVTKFTDQSDPAMLTWTGEGFNRSITGIFEQDNNVHFEYMAVQNGSPLSLDVDVLDYSTLSLSWEPASDNSPVLVAWSENGVFGTPENGIEYSSGDVILGGGTVLYMGDVENTFVHSNLESSTTYFYSIWSYSDDKWSAPLEANGLTNALSVSTFPWDEGFESGITEWRQSFSRGAISWRVESSGDESLPADSYEGSHFAYFHAADVDQKITTLESPILEFEDGNTYVLDFRHFQASWEGDQDWLKVLVKLQGETQWEEIAYYTDEAELWMQRRVEIPYSEPLQIAFQGVSNYAHGIGIDDIKVYVGFQCNEVLGAVSDLTLESYTETSMRVSWNMPLDNNVLIAMRKIDQVSDLPDIGVSYTPSNEYGNGDYFDDGSFVVYSGDGSSVEITGLDHSSEYNLAFFTYTNDYCYSSEAERIVFSTVQVFHPLKVSVKIDGQPINGAIVSLGDEQKITDDEGEVLWTVGHSDIYYPLSIEYPGYISVWQRYIPDGQKDINVDLEKSNLNVPRNLRHDKSFKTVTLNWDPVIDENFDGYNPFALEMEGWSMTDNDSLATYGLSGLSFINEFYVGSFIVIDPYYEGLLQADFDLTAYSGRNVLAAIAGVGGVNDDWLISPELEIFDGDYFSFMSRSLSDNYGLESIRVLISENGVEEEDFVLLSPERIDVPVEWTSYSFDLSDYVGKRVNLAIQYVSNDSHVLLLDNLFVGANPESTENIAPVYNSYLSKAHNSSVVHRVTSEDQKRVQSVSSSTIFGTGRVGYNLRLNGEIQGEVSGFSSTSITIDVNECFGNEFELQSRDDVYSSTSMWTDGYFVNACNNVTFVVLDKDGNPIEGAKVKFDLSEMLTNSQGELVFLGVSNYSSASFEVTATGYMPEVGELIVLGDKTVQVQMTAISTDSTLVKDSDIDIFPNPVAQDLWVKGIYGEIDIEVYDFSGRLIRAQQIEAYTIFSLSLNDLKEGIYLIQFSVGGKEFIRKIVKK